MNLMRRTGLVIPILAFSCGEVVIVGGGAPGATNEQAQGDSGGNGGSGGDVASAASSGTAAAPSGSGSGTTGDGPCSGEVCASGSECFVAKGKTLDQGVCSA
jgi:hypothetical protein